MWQVLRAVALAHEVAQMPQQLNTWLGPGGWELSGGQARRLCLARALLKPAELLILDEPFTGVGNAQAVAIADAIEPWLAGKAVLILSHENAFKSSVPVLNYATIRAL